MMTRTPRFTLATLACLTSSALAREAAADPLAPGPPVDVTAPAPAPEIEAEPPIVAYGYTAFGVPRGTLGAAAYGVGLVPGSDQRATLGGGVTAWGSPVDRLTLVGDASRDALGNFAPSGAAVVRILGNREQGWSLGAIGKLKVDGFGMGPSREMESEIESGLLLSQRRDGWYLDLDAIGGVGLGDDGEVDVEARLRAGRSLTTALKIGIDGQWRARVAGDRRLYGERTWDFASGAQVLVGMRRFFAALTTGPSTVGVWQGVGWSTTATLGVTPF